MKNQKSPLPLDKDVEDEISKLASEEDQKPLEKSKANNVAVKVNTVDLATVIKFEDKAKIKTEEEGKNEKSGQDEGSGGDIDRDEGSGRKASLSRGAIKRKSFTIY